MKLEDQLTVARADLAAAETSLASVHAGEDAAAGTSKSYAEWRAARSDAAVEVERLRRLVAKLIADAEVDARVKAEDAQAAIEVDANSTADAAASAIVEGLELVHEVIRKIMTAIVVSDTKIELANRGRRSGLPPLDRAEVRARRGEKLERHVIEQTEYVAWSFADDKRPLGEEQAALVMPSSGNRGRLRSESGVHEVVRRRFREVRSLPETAATYFEPMAGVLSIPPIRAGGAPGWVPMKHATTPDIHRQLDELAAITAQPDRRRPQVEIVCLGDASDVAA